MRVTVAPTGELLTTTEAKAHCRVEHDADNALFARWVKAARQMVERESGCRLLTQTVEVTFAEFPSGNYPLELPVFPVQSVSSVTYRRASDGAETSLTGFQSWVAHNPPLVGWSPADGGWPETDLNYLVGVTVTAAAGWSSLNEVPFEAVQAALLAIGYWNSFRGDGRDPNTIPNEYGLPPGAVRLINLLRGIVYR